MSSKDPKDYEKSFSQKGFFDKLATSAVQAGRELVEQGVTLYYTWDDSDTPMGAKLTIMGALGYFISPLDFIPDLTPILGYTDDATVIAMALATVASHIKPVHREKAKAAVKEYLG